MGLMRFGRFNLDKLLWNSEVNVDQLQCPVPTQKESKLEQLQVAQHARISAKTTTTEAACKLRTDGKWSVEWIVERVECRI